MVELVHVTVTIEICGGGFYENNHYYSTHTISSPYKWYGWFLDRLGIVRFRSATSEQNRRKVVTGVIKVQKGMFEKEPRKGPETQGMYGFEGCGGAKQECAH